MGAEGLQNLGEAGHSAAMTKIVQAYIRDIHTTVLSSGVPKKKEVLESIMMIEQTKMVGLKVKMC